MIEIGTICIKNLGREAGRYCVVVKKTNKTFVIISGPRLLTGVKRRKCNIAHLTPTENKIEIKEDATDEEIISAMEKQHLTTKLNLKKPSAAEMKQEHLREQDKKVEAEKKEVAKKNREGRREESCEGKTQN